MTSSKQNGATAGSGKRGSKLKRALVREWPSTLLIVLSLIGIAYTDVSPTRSAWYWQLLAVVFCAVCVLTQWSTKRTLVSGRMRLIWTQVLHWGAFLVAMRLAFLPVVSENMSSDITGLVLLYALALSTFLAGVYLHWKLIVVGAFLACGMVAVAYIDQATVMMVLIAVLVGGALLLVDNLPFGSKPDAS